MNTLSTTELSRMRSTAAETFFDACKLGTATASGFGSDPGDSTYSYANEIDCGFWPSPKQQSGEAGEGVQAPMFDALLRLPVDTDITNIDRVQMTARHGEALSPVEYYAIEGKPSLGPSAIVLKLKLIVGVSAE